MYKKNVKHSFKVFAEDLKKEQIGSVLLLYGTEQYLVRWAVDTLVKKYVNPAAAALDYVLLDSEAVTADQIIEACETFSMFSEKRIVWVRDFRLLAADSVKGWSKEDIHRLTSYIQTSNDGTILIFSAEEIKASAALTASLKKKARCYDFDRIDKAELASFARKRFRAAGVEIGSGTLGYLIETTGYFNRESDYRLFHFENDIRKIIAHSDGVRITETDVAGVVDGDADTFVFDMLDGISGNQKDKAFRILYNILHSGRDPFSLIGAVVSQFEMMLSVKQMREDGLDLSAMQKKLGGSEYRIRKMIPYTNKYSVAKLKQILSSAYETDRNIKTGLLEGQLALEMFIAGI